ncbi:MAG: AbgT family transporter, partial [Xanthomonadales bacterium]|nr:AbgT family transporter [Xanthomonadales bacterium]
MNTQQNLSSPSTNTGMLAAIERIGNRLPDPAVLFIALLFIVWLLSWLLSYISFETIDPRSGQTLVVNN